MLDDPLVAELLGKRLVGVFGTLEPDGAIHAVAIWYALEGEEIVLATGSRSRKVANLTRDDRATLTVHDSRPGAEVCGACLVGRGAVATGRDAARSIDLVHRRYVDDAGLGLPSVRDFLGSDDVAIRFRPERAFTWDERGSEAARVLAQPGRSLPLEPTSTGGYGASVEKHLQ